MRKNYSLLKFNNNKGVVLILTYLLIVTLSILGMAFFARTLGEKRVSSVEKDSITAFNMAEAGLARAIAYLRAHTPSPLNTQPVDPFSGTQTICAEPNLNNCTNTTATKGSYLVSIDPFDDNSSHPESSKFTISVKGTSNQTSRAITTTVMTDNFSRFAYFSDTEHFGQGWSRTPVWFIGVDQIWGPTHTNGHFHISGNPIFYSETASTDNFITYYHGGPPDDNPQFLGGLTLGKDAIVMPHQAIALHNAAVTGGIVYNNNTAIVLNSSGTMNVTNSQVNCNPCNNVALPANHALYVSGGDLSVSGTLSGSLTVGSNRNIIITNNILYNQVPTGSVLCNDGTGRVCSDTASDMLGIIAEKQVIVSSSAPYNLEIDASIMSMDSSFLVEDWQYGPAKGTLKVFGGIIQDQRGPVGTFNSSTNTVQSGYAKRYIYDSRFTTSPPLYFPETGDYLKLAWYEIELDVFVKMYLQNRN